MAVRIPLFNALRGRIYPDQPELGDMPMLLLLYLVFLSMPWVVGDSASIPMTLLSIALFLPLYFLQWSSNKPLPIVFGIWSIWFLFERFNWGCNTYVVYACAIAAGIPRIRAAALTLACLIAATFVTLLIRQAPLEAFVVPGLMSALVFAFSRLDHESRRQQRFLRASMQEISKLAERSERDRIARDVHDLLGHSLTLIALNADLASKQIDVDIESAKRSLQQIKATARESLTEVRQVVHGMRAAQVSVELAKSKLACEVSDIVLYSDIHADLQLTRTVEDVLASVLREAVNNVIRHAKARRVEITLQLQRSELILKVKDDGKAKSPVEGQGLRGMRERAESIAATIDFTHDNGFCVTLRLPIRESGSVPEAAQLAQRAWAR